MGSIVYQAKPSIKEIEENRSRLLSQARRNRERNIARELKMSELTPHNPGSQFGGWAGTDHVVCHDLPAPRPVTKEDRWQRHLALNIPQLF
jgi:hypothetical protein